MASRPAACRSSSAWPSPPTSATPSSRCSVETNSSPRRRASASAWSMTRLRPRVERERAALDAGALGEDRRDLAAERGQVDAEAAERLGRDAVVGFDEGAQQMLGVEHRALQPFGRRLGGDDGLLGLLGESVELHRVVRSRSVCGRGQRGSGWSTRSKKVRAAASRLVREVRSAGRPAPWRTGRRGRSPSRRGMPWPVSRNVRPVLGTGRDRAAGPCP